MTATYLRPSHGLKSPACGGFWGPTPPQPPHHPVATWLKSPQHGGQGTRSRVMGPPPASRGEEEEELKQKNEPTFAT
jgi:hypothetical protein